MSSGNALLHLSPKRQHMLDNFRFLFRFVFIFVGAVYNLAQIAAPVLDVNCAKSPKVCVDLDIPMILGILCLSLSSFKVAVVQK